MPELRTSTLVEAPVRTVAGALLDTSLITRFGVRVSGPLLCAGDTLTGPFGVALSVTRADETGVSASGGFLSLSTDLVETGGGTMVVDLVSWTMPGGVLGRFVDVLLGRGMALKVLEQRASALTSRCSALVSGQVVVGAAIVRDGLVLAQQRAYPAAHAGQWELPGGRVESGESDAEALVRECVEELGVEIVVGEQVGPDVPLRSDLLLRVYAAKTSGTPEALEHHGVRWVSVSDLPTLDWLPADRVLLPALTTLL